jgi:hypothetical protein
MTIQRADRKVLLPILAFLVAVGFFSCHDRAQDPPDTEGMDIPLVDGTDSV